MCMCILYDNENLTKINVDKDKDLILPLIMHHYLSIIFIYNTFGVYIIQIVLIIKITYYFITHLYFIGTLMYLLMVNPSKTVI